MHASPKAPTPPPPLAFENGSWLRLTGVCDKPNGPAARESFSLLLRENEDIALISRPPWLSAQRVRWLLGTPQHADHAAPKA
jgi:hypothetical protein